MVRAALRPRHDVIDREVAEQGVVSATGAMPLLPDVERVAGRLVRWELAQLRPLRDICPDNGIEPVEQRCPAHHPSLDEFTGLG